MKENYYYSIEDKNRIEKFHIKCLSENENNYEIFLLEKKEKISVPKNIIHNPIIIDVKNFGKINSILKKHNVKLYPISFSKINNLLEYSGGLWGFYLIKEIEEENFANRLEQLKAEFQNEKIDYDDIKREINFFSSYNDLFDKFKTFNIDPTEEEINQMEESMIKSN